MAHSAYQSRFLGGIPENNFAENDTWSTFESILGIRMVTETDLFNLS
jgi:hypothetical protein